MFCKNHGFVSPFSLQERSEQVIISSRIVLESWPRGRRCSPAKRVYAKSVSGVRIPSSPPPNISRGLNVLAVQTSFSLIFRLSKFPNFPRFSCNFCNFFGHYAIKCNQISCFWQTNNYQISVSYTHLTSVKEIIYRPFTWSFFGVIRLEIDL